MELPRIQPIALTWRKEPFDDPEWIYECKYDGYRALCYLEQRRNRLISRNSNIMTRFDELAEQVAGVLDVDDAILDGEVIAADEDGRPQFYDLLRGTRSPCGARNRSTIRKRGTLQGLRSGIDLAPEVMEQA